MQKVLLVSLVMLGLAVPTRAAAQTAFARGWVDINFGAASAAEPSFRMMGVEILFDEPARSRVDYGLPRGASFDFGAGLMVTPLIGVGISFSGTAHRDVADLRIEIPHPFFFNAYAVDQVPTADPLGRAEGGTHLQLMVVAHDRDGLRIRLFGGPSYIRVEQDAVDTILYHQVFGLFTTVNAVTITEFEARTVEAGGWGFHAGGDVSYFLTRVVGLGGFVRVTRATAEIANTIGTGRVSVTTGGVQMGGGLRLRF